VTAIDIYKTEKNRDDIQSSVASISIGQRSISYLKEPITISFKRHSGVGGNGLFVFWNFSQGLSNFHSFF
jgi:hypothetical protein